jgi:hypothetical protein
LASFSAASFLNLFYEPLDTIHTTSVRAQPLLKKYSFRKHGGEAVVERFVLSGPRGSSGDLTSAQTVAAITPNANYFRWLVEHGTYEGEIRIPHKDVAMSRGDRDAAARALRVAVDTGLEDFGAQQVRMLLGRAGLSIGIAEWEVTAGTPTGFPAFALRFANPEDAANLQVGDLVRLSAGDGTSGAHTLIAGTGYVMARDVDLGYVQIAATTDITTPASPDAAWTDDTNFSVFRLGEFLPGDPTAIITSWDDYVPTAVSTTTLNGLTRSSDSLLCGSRLTTTEAVGPLAQRLKKLVNKMRARVGQMPTSGLLCVMHPEDWGLLEEQINATVERSPASSTEDGYSSIKVMTASGSIDCVSEPYQRKGFARLIDPSKMRIHSPTGTLLEWVDDDGSIVKILSTNQLILRPVSYPAHTIGQPFAHGIFSTS